MHVLADALTSVLAIVALSCGLLFGWVWMDPLMALVGVGVILSWSFGLIRSFRRGARRHGAGPAARRARSASGSKSAATASATCICGGSGPGTPGVIAAVVSDRPQAPSAYKARLEGVDGLSHVTVEVHACEDHQRKAA